MMRGAKDDLKADRKKETSPVCHYDSECAEKGKDLTGELPMPEAANKGGK